MKNINWKKRITAFGIMGAVIASSSSLFAQNIRWNQQTFCNQSTYYRFCKATRPTYILREDCFKNVDCTTNSFCITIPECTIKSGCITIPGCSIKPVTPEKPEVPEVPEKPVTPEKPEVPEVPEKPVAPEKPEVPEKPVTPVTPEVPANQSFEQQVLTLVNVERQKAGLNPLVMDEKLSDVARLKSQDMNNKNYFSHTSPTYGSPFDMMKQFGISYRAAGENIAMGYPTPEAVVDGWMNSPGHRANILKSNFTHMGVGYIADGHYWTQMFIQK